MRNKEDSLRLIDFEPTVVVDVGAAAGTIGLYNIWPKVPHILIEPIASMLPNLKRFAQNVQDVRILNCLAGETDGEKLMAISPNGPFLVAAENGPKEWKRQSLQIRAVDSILEEHGFNEGPYLIKIDVDGAEMAVLKGCVQAISRSSVLVIESTLLASRFPAIQSIIMFLSELGYALYDIVEPVYRPTDQALWQVDTVFVPMNHTVRKQLTFR